MKDTFKPEREWGEGEREKKERKERVCVIHATCNFGAIRPQASQCWTCFFKGIAIQQLGLRNTLLFCQIK